MSMISKLREKAWQIRDDFRRRRYLRKVARGHRRFDDILGTDTARVLEPDVEDGADRAAELANHYEAVNESGFRTIVECLVPTPSEYAFFDVGSGMGKALIMAMLYPFRKIRGLEFDESMHLTAVRNLEQAMGRLDVRCADVESSCMDASKFDAYDDKSFVLFFNSFGGEVLDRFVDRLEDHARDKGAEIILAYLNPTEPARFDASSYLHELVRTARLIVYATKGVELDMQSRERLLRHYSNWVYVAGPLG